jgi:DNA-binding NarL/FixJ family response regulator
MVSLSKHIKVLIADNEEVFREGLTKLLQEQPNISVVFQGSAGEEAIRAATERHPDVVLVNGGASQREVLDTVTAMARQAPDAKVAVIAHPEPGTGALNLLKAGARACLAKSISAADLVKSIELISSGRIIISPLFAQEFLGEVVTAEKDDQRVTGDSTGVLSQREMEIVKLIAEGNTNKEIAAKLFIAENTVKAHVKNALHKLELRNRQQLVVYAVLQKWVTTEREPADGPK